MPFAASTVPSSSMAVFMDLNIRVDPDRTKLQRLIDTAAHLGFSTVALNYVFEPSTKKKQEIPVPTPISELISPLPVVQGRSHPIRVLNRLTVVTSDASHFRPNASEYRRFDLLAIEPTTEKLFHAACMNCDVDIVCISVTEKLPFFFKRAPINGAVDRGVLFELTYSAAIRDSTRRRYTIANAICLTESCKGKNVILSSAAEKALELRGPYDIITLGSLFGLSDEDSKEAISASCRLVLLHAETRRTASGIISTSKIHQMEALQDRTDCDEPTTKRPKLT